MRRLDLNHRAAMPVDVFRPDPVADGRARGCQRRRHHGGLPVSRTPVRELRFARTPVVMPHTSRPAATPGAGRFAVGKVVDDAVTASSRFDIVG